LTTTPSEQRNGRQSRRCSLASLLCARCQAARKIARTSTLAIACCAPIATIWAPVIWWLFYEEGGEVLAVGERNERVKGAGDKARVQASGLTRYEARASTWLDVPTDVTPSKGL
jgi:hypothetical protein